MMTNYTESGTEFAGDFLEHYGVKGMKWGVRRDRTPTSVTVKTAPGKRVKAKGGKFQDPSEDAVTAARLRQQAKRSTTDSLSNKELQALVTRMNLEEQYDRLRKSDVQMSAGRQFAKNLLKDADGDLVVSAIGKGASVAGLPFGSKATTGVKVGLAVAKAAAGVKKTNQSKKKK